MVLVRYNNVKKEMEASHRLERMKVDRDAGRVVDSKAKTKGKAPVKIDLTAEEKW